MTSFTSATFDGEGNCYTAGANGQVYVWRSRELRKTILTHEGNFVSAIKYADGKLYCGGKDGKLVIVSTTTQTYDILKTVEVKA